MSDQPRSRPAGGPTDPSDDDQSEAEAEAGGQADTGQRADADDQAAEDTPGPKKTFRVPEGYELL